MATRGGFKVQTITKEEHEMVECCRDMKNKGVFDYEELSNRYIDLFVDKVIPEKLLIHRIPQEVRRFWGYMDTEAWERLSSDTKEAQLKDMWKKNGTFYVEKMDLEVRNKQKFDNIVYMIKDLKDKIRIDKAMNKLREIASAIRSVQNPTVFVNMSILNPQKDDE